MIETGCAFTGHRPHKFPWKYDESDGRCLALKAELAGQIAVLAGDGITDFYSGMADGSDIWLSQAVLALRGANSALRLHCVLPCEGQDAHWSAAARRRYQAVLEQADSVDYVSRRYYNGCMLARNRRLVDSAAFLFAVYNGERRGGTASTVNYARKLGRTIFLLDPVTLRIEQAGGNPVRGLW